MNHSVSATRKISHLFIMTLLRSGARQPGAETNRTKPYTEKDLLTGELAILG